MESTRFNIEKVRAISSYLADKVSNLYITKFYKLLYYIDFVSYAKRESSITGDLYFKLPYGPVPTLIKNEVDNLASKDSDIVSQLSKNIKIVSVPGDGSKHIIKNVAKNIDINALSVFEINIVKKISTKFLKTTSVTLSNRTHREAPFRLTSANSAIPYEFAKKLDVASILD